MRLPAYALVWVFSACVETSAQRDDPAPDPRSLFDGQTLSNWDGDARFWRVEEGAIVGESTPANPCQRTTYLVWQGGELADFELHLRWRFGHLAAGNSGVQFRSRASSHDEVRGYQADLEVGPDWTGGLYEQDGRAVVTRRGERTVLDAQGGKAVERFADGRALLERVDPAGWNQLRIVAFGPRLTIEVNGELFSETIDLDPERAARRGKLALQLHAGAPMRVEFRDLELCELGDAAALAAARGAWDVTGDPRWIWASPEPPENEIAWFRRRFELDAKPERAELWASGDNHFDAWLNGTGVATSDDWLEPVRVGVRGALKTGENELLVRAQNDDGPAALAVALEIEGEDGARSTIVSDATWSSCVQDPAAPPSEHELGAWLAAQDGWTPAHAFGPLDTEPWCAEIGSELAEVRGQNSSAPPGSSIEVPTGFRVELLHSVDLETEGSWVSLAADPSGRLYASDQYGGLFRITPEPGSDVPARVEPLDLPLGEAHGLLWAFDALYVVVSGAREYESGLYRARDTDADGELDSVELLRAFDGDGEHGPHAVLLHPDGRSLVVVAGNHTRLPEPLDRTRLPRNWGEDALLPFHEDPNGHGIGIHAPGGWIARTDPDGRTWELMAAGLRNSYDIAFSAAGELFTYDSDMEWDFGLPWYRPTRILHVTSGAEFGWRAGSSTWPADVYDALPAALDLELASPTGMVFGEALSFPGPWKHALFACDWAYGRIFAISLEERGASYRGHAQVFARGEPFQVTDLCAGADGALYVTTGGRQTQSGLYRITWEGAAPAEAREHVDEASAALRALRRELERFHGPLEDASAAAEQEAVSFAWSRLDHPDRFVRYAARIALEHRDPSLWGDRARAERDPRRSLEALLALVRSDATADAEFVVARALEIFETSEVREERLDSLRLLELAWLRLAAGDELRSRAAERLVPRYPTGDERLDRALLPLCVFLGGDVAGSALARLEAVSTQKERIAVLYSLRALDSAWTEADARRLLRAFQRELFEAHGGVSVHGYLEALRDDALANVGGLFDAAALAELTEPPVAPVAAEVEPAVSGSGPASAHAWTMAELQTAYESDSRRRSFERGRAAYLRASCTTCHRLKGEGGDQGPDLTGAGSRYSGRDLLLAILEPSREVPDVWRETELWGEDELLACGRIERLEAQEIVVREAGGRSVSVPREFVREERPHPLSRMPEGLLDLLSSDEIFDLVAYVLAGADPTDKRFIEAAGTAGAAGAAGAGGAQPDPARSDRFR